MAHDAAAARKLTPLASLGWATGELGIAAYVGITMSFMLFYATEALGISPFWAGITLLIPRLWDAFIDPFVGAISDRTESRMGRRRPYLLFGALTFGIAFALIFRAPAQAGEVEKILYVTALYLVTSTAFTFYDVPYSSMAAEMTTDYRDRTKLTGYKMIAARLGILITILIAPGIFTTPEGPVTGFARLGVIFGAFMVVTGVVAFFTTRNAPQIVRTVERIGVRAEYRALVANRPLMILWCAFLAQNLAIGASATTLIYYVVFVLKMPPVMVGTFATTGAIAATLATPVWVWISRRLGKRDAYMIALVGALLFSLPALLLSPSTAWLLFPILALAGLFDAGNQLLPNAMVADTIEYDELSTGQRREGAVFGTWAFCRKLGMAGGAFAVSVFLGAFGFKGGAHAGVQSAEALLGIRLAYAVIPFTLWAIALLIVPRYFLTEQRFNAIKSEILLRSDT